MIARGKERKLLTSSAAVSVFQLLATRNALTGTFS